MVAESVWSSWQQDLVEWLVHMLEAQEAASWTLLGVGYSSKRPSLKCLSTSLASVA